jgi:putative membrane protein
MLGRPDAPDALRGRLKSMPSLFAHVAVALIALLHVYILVLEMFLWTTPRGRRAFGLTPEFAQATRALAANQGLYNGFLAAGLAWGLTGRASDPGVVVFFLGCVIVAGVFGGFTASRKILYIQALPAAVALALVLAAWN